MMIEIKGCGNHNKGAEMMLLTILQELKDENRKFCVPAQYNCNYECYSRYGLYPKLWLKVKGFQLGYLGKFIPKKLYLNYCLFVDRYLTYISRTH